MKPMRLTDEKWLRILRLIFTLAGYFFLFAVITQINQKTHEYLSLQEIYAALNLQTFNFDRYLNNPWIIVVSEFLAVFVTIQAIKLTLQRQVNWRTISLSVLYLSAAFFVVFVIAGLQGQIILIRRDMASVSYELDVALSVLGRFELLPEYDKALLVQAEESADKTIVISTLITAITGMVSAVTAFYAQILLGRKTRAELEIERLKLALEQQKAIPPKTKRRKAASKHKTEKSKSAITRKDKRQDEP